MKKNILLLGILVIINTGHAQPIKKEGEEYIAVYPGLDKVILTYEFFSYYNNVGLEFNGIKFPKQLILAKPKFMQEHSLPFLTSDDGKRILILHDDRICICFGPKEIKNLDVPFFRGINTKADQEYELTSPYLIKASSSLKEGEKKYKPDDLGSIRLEYPWSEGSPGYGIGEWLIFGVGSNTERIGKPIGVYLINGYISFTNPERYTNNGRIKKLTLTSLRTGKSMQYDVLDTPNPQFLSTKELGGYEFKLVIDDVYPGEKYEDTCIGGLLSLNVSWGGPVPEDYLDPPSMFLSP